MIINIYVENVQPSGISKEDKVPCLWATLLYFRILMYFRINNCNIVSDFKKADYVLLNTCSVSDHYEQYILNRLNIIKLYNKWVKKIIIFWCLATKENKLSKIVDYFIPIWDNNKLDEIFWLNIFFKDIPYFNSSLNFNKNTLFKKDTYYLGIWRWCIHNCSYCWIKKWIWFIKSRPLESIYKEVRLAIKHGFKKICLVTDDLWSYGEDIGINFVTLIEWILQLSPELIISISNIEPSQLIKYYDLFKKNISRINSIVLPVQSFNDILLKSMNRKYTVNDYINLISDIKKHNKYIDIQNHIIYWYPWETLIIFLQNIYISIKLPIQTAFLEFQDRKWTIANTLPNKVLWSELLKMRQILQKFKKKYPKKIVG